MTRESITQDSFLEDYEWIRKRASGYVSQFENSSVLIVGASGFIGSWLLGFLSHLKKTEGINLNITAIRRRTEFHQNKDLNDSGINWLFGNISEIKFNDLQFSHIYFCATPSQQETGSNDLVKLAEATLSGTDSLLKLAQRQKQAPRYINLSSGGVYQFLSEVISPSPEIEIGRNERLESKSYAQMKLQSELMIENATKKGTIIGTNPRLFTFSGPMLPLKAHFAFGNFLFGAKYLKEIKVTGDPETVRSYLYVAELILWLIVISEKPSLDPTNLGSPHPTTMLNLAQKVGKLNPPTRVIHLDNQQKVSSYYPEVNRMNVEFGLSQEITIEEQIYRHGKWLEKIQFSP